MPPTLEQAVNSSKARYLPFKRPAKGMGAVSTMPPAKQQAVKLDFNKRPTNFDFNKRTAKGKGVAAAMPPSIEKAGHSNFSIQFAKTKARAAAMPPAIEQTGSFSKARYTPYDLSKRPTKGKGGAAVGEDSESDWEPKHAAYSQSEDGDEPATPPPPARDPVRVPEIEKRSAINTHKGVGMAAAGNDSGSDWEPEQAAYSQSEDGDEPATPPPPARDPNRVPEIEKQSAINIHKLKAWQFRRLEPIRTELDPKKPGKELVYYKLREVVALASAEKYRSPIKHEKRNHIERMRNPTTADLLRKQRAARKANTTLNGETSTQANNGESSTHANKARTYSSWFRSVSISSDDELDNF